MIERAPFGIKELDGILSGGIPSGKTVLLAGSPGAGKTILGTQFLVNGAGLFGEKGVFVSFTDSPNMLREYMLTLGWDLAKLDSEGKLMILDLAPTLKQGVGDSIDLMLQKASALQAKRLVLDSLPALSLAFDSGAELRGLISILFKRLKEIGVTSIVITESPRGSKSTGAGSEEFLSDGIIVLEMLQRGAEYVRRLSVPKMRFTSHDTRFYRYVIEPTKGIVLLPVAEAQVKVGGDSD